MWFGLGWSGLLLFVGLKSRFALGRELRIPREAWPLGGSIRAVPQMPPQMPYLSQLSSKSAIALRSGTDALRSGTDLGAGLCAQRLGGAGSERVAERGSVHAHERSRERDLF